MWGTRKREGGGEFMVRREAAATVVPTALIPRAMPEQQQSIGEMGLSSTHHVLFEVHSTVYDTGEMHLPHMQAHTLQRYSSS